MNEPILFFTAEDPREIPKGSRDPLRFLPVWSKVARKMIPYLTTVTPSYRGFLTRFIFHAAIEEFSPRLANGSKKEQWGAFNKFEQLCAIVRSHTEPATPDFPGKSNIFNRNKNGKADVGNNLDYWLMRSQENTGFWGYYHQASLGGGLLKQNSHPNHGYILTEQAKQAAKNNSVRNLISQYASFLKTLFEQKKLEFVISEFSDLGQFFAQKPAENNESEWELFWKSRLLVPETLGNEAFNSSIQNDFAQAIIRISKKTSLANPAEIWERLAEMDNDDAITRHAQSVKSTEAVIGLCEWVFDVCRLRSEGGESLKKASEWAMQNGFNDLWHNKLRQIEEPVDPELSKFRHIALYVDQSFELLANELIKRHQAIMQQRKGAPWVEVLDDGALHVREAAVEPRIPDLDEGSSGIRWRYDYFLGSWMNVARELGYIKG